MTESKKSCVYQPQELEITEVQEEMCLWVFHMTQSS